MEAKPQSLVEYVLPNGESPFGRWFQGLRDQRAQVKIDVRLARLRLGNFGDSKTVGGGVLELRIPYGPGYRIYLARSEETVVLLLCGGDKTSQRRDIETAKQFWRDYQRRSR